MDINEFSYGGIESGTFNITGDFEAHSILPAQKKYVKEIPGMDGVVDFGIGGYDVRVITVPIYYDGDYAELRTIREQIIAWLSNSNGAAKQLIFGNEPDRYYMAKCYAAIDFRNSNDRQIGEIQFECNPPWQYHSGVLLTPAEIVWNTQDGLDGTQWMKIFTVSGSIRLTNSGMQTVKPIIKLVGAIHSGLLLTCGIQSWQYDADLIYGGIMIDCNAETVTAMSDESNLFGNVNATKDDYFNLPSGQVEIGVTDVSLGAWPNDLTVIIDFNPIGAG